MNEQAIGELLAKLRKEQKLKLKKASAELRIRQEYLEAIEEGRLSRVSKHIYPSGYIKSYASWLGVSSEEISALLKGGKQTGANVEELPAHKKKPMTKAGSAITDTGKVGFGTIFSFLSPPSFTSSRHQSPNLRMLRVGANTTITALLMAGITYGVWAYIDSSSPELLPENVSLEQQDAGKTLSGLHADGTQKLVMFANKETLLYLHYVATDIREKHLLSVGEAYFVPENTAIYIDADHPDAVEVFAGKEGDEFLGTLQELSAKE